MTEPIRKQTKIWITKEKQKIRICDMEDSHLINTIKLLERNASKYEQQIINQGYQILGMLNGEMAIESVENDLFNIGENGIDIETVFPIYSNLTLEAERRGLSWNQS